MRYLHLTPLRTPDAKVLARSILLGPEEGPDKYLYMAQLHEGREALGYYEKGLELLQRQLADGAVGTKEAEAALRQRVCMAHCSIGELFLTDLCFDQDAESRCQVRRGGACSLELLRRKQRIRGHWVIRPDLPRYTVLYCIRVDSRRLAMFGVQLHGTRW